MHTPDCTSGEDNSGEEEEKVISPTSRGGASTKNDKSSIGTEDGDNDGCDEHTGLSADGDSIVNVVGDELFLVCME